MNRSPRRRPRAQAWLLASLVATGCGMNAASDLEAAGAPAPGAREGASDGAGSGGAAAPPQEREVESDYEAPVATGSFVWVANPKSGRVAYVDARSLTVRTVDAGDGPTYLAPLPGGEDAAIVLNVRSEDATLLRARPDGSVARTTFKTARAANAWAFGPGGQRAIAWADARKVADAPRTEGFQEITLLDTTGVRAPEVLAVGYRPVSVGFDATGQRAYAVTQDGVSIVDVAATPAKVVRNVPLSADPREDPRTRDVVVTPDGSLALVRRDGRADVLAISLTTGQSTTITLPGEVTDLDLADTGTRAVAVVRDQATAVVMPVPGIVAAPASFTTLKAEGETIGQVVLAPGGASGLLFSNATPVERVTLATFEPLAARPVRLYAPVLSVHPAPDARHAVVLHGATSSAVEEDASPGAFSLVPTTEALPPRIVGLEAPPSAVAVTADRAVVAERDDARGVYGAYLARLPSFMVDRYPLASPPLAVGIVAGARRAFVAQAHPEGRLTFIDLETGTSRTLTGFELASRVVDGSQSP